MLEKLICDYCHTKHALLFINYFSYLVNAKYTIFLFHFPNKNPLSIENNPSKRMLVERHVDFFW